MDVEALKNWRWESPAHQYGDRDVILYALGLGLGTNTTDRDELRFLTENDLTSLPTLGTVINRFPLRACFQNAGMSSIEVYHGEQRSRFDRLLPPAGTVSARGQVVGLWDKGADRGALVETEHELFDPETKQRYCVVRSLVFARREGGFGGPSDGPPKLTPVPASPPEAVFDMPTLPQLALIYRLNGDRNPIHSDPDTARQAGLPRPILHGYCTYGIAGWAITKLFLDYNASRLASLDCRFSGPAFPGETLRVEMWRVAEDRVAFQVRVVERNVIVISNGSADIRP